MKTPSNPPTDHRTSIVLVDDHAMFRKGLRLLLEQEAGLRVVAEASDGQSAIDQVREWSPDVVVMDVTMPKFNGIEATRRIVAEFPQTRVVALSVHGGRQFVEDMLQAGAAGYILKESAPEELVKGIETVARGEIYLSPAITRVVVSQFKKTLSGSRPGEPSSSLTSRDTEFLKLIAKGKSAKQIARALRMKPDTLRTRQQQIKAKIGVESDEELTAYAEASLDRNSQQTERAAGLSAETILQTKLHPPALDTDLVSRPRLLEKLNANSQRPLTLVSAPAGYGKSTLIAQWFASLKTRSAWLSLSEEESDLRLFLSYLVAAIQTRFPKACSETATLLGALELPSNSVLADTLSNDLDELSHPLILALDDYHHIHNSEIHDLLDELLRYPPRQIQFILVTRRDPPIALASLRARGCLTEIGLDDLRFSTSETQVVLKQKAEVTLSEEGCAQLDKELEGWIAGLHLLCLVLRNRKDHDAYLSQLKGGIQHINEYLVAEVLALQRTEVQDLLLRTSLLDRFCAPLCQAIGSRLEDSASAMMPGKDFIATILQEHLFVIPLDTHGEWFRYHHLFQQLLQQQLRSRSSTKDIAIVHIRASAWFESKGLIEESLHHALAAGDAELAAQLVERHRQSAVNADQWYLLEKWLSLLPDAVVQQRPELLMARAWVFLHHSRFDLALPILDLVETLLDDDPVRKPLRGEIALFRGYALFFLGEGAHSLKYIDQALDQIPASYYEARAQSEVIHALASQMEGRKEKALRGLDDLLLHYDSPEDLRKTRLLITYVFIHIISGDLVSAEVSNRRVRQVTQRGGYAYAEAWVDYLQGSIHLVRCELDKAAECLKRSVSQRFIHFKKAAVDSIIALMMTYQARGRRDEAQAMLELLREFFVSLDDPTYSALVSSAELRLAIFQGRQDEAIRLLNSIELPGNEAMLWWLEVPSVTRCRALITEGSAASLQEAEDRLSEYASKNEAHHNHFQLIGIVSLLAMAREKLGKREEACSTLEKALAIAEPGRIIFPFLELGAPMAEMLRRARKKISGTAQIDRILAAFSNEKATTSKALSPTRPAEQPLIEPLTNRELDVLELLVQRLQDKEMAQQLSLSPQTIKAHLKHIYQKLGVKGRRQAAERAVELGLVKGN